MIINGITISTDSVETQDFDEGYVWQRVEVTIKHTKEVIKTKISKEFEKYLVTDRVDAYVWGLLTLAMFLGEDIESDLPISESLYYNLEFHFIPTLTQNTPEWKRIHIKTPLIPDMMSQERNIIATGISCGVDSLYTVASHSVSNIPHSHKINTLAFFNAGSSYYPNQPLQTPLVNGRIKLAQDFAEEYGFKFLFIESDIIQVYAKYHSYSHAENHTYSMLFCTYMIQGALRHYYYSSAYSYNEFSFKAIAEQNGSAGHYDLFTLKMASIAGLQYHSTGSDVTRFGKTKYLVNYQPARKYLNVCVKDIVNCCTCNKCLRTIFTLDALGALSKFSNVFDIEKFNKNRKFWLQELYMGAKYDHDILLQEILPYFQHEITLIMKLRTFLVSVKRRFM